MTLGFSVAPEAVGVGLTVSAVISGLLVTTGPGAQGWRRGQVRWVGTGCDPGPRNREQTFDQLHNHTWKPWLESHSITPTQHNIDRFFWFISWSG